MVFAGGIGGKILGALAKLDEGLGKLAKEMNRGAKASNDWDRVLGKWIKGVKERRPILTATAEAFAGIAEAGVGMIGMIFQLADMMGILEPILSLFNGVLGIIAGAAMEQLIPAIQRLAQVLFSPQMIEIWGMLGETIGGFLGQLIDMLVTVLSNASFREVIKVFIQIFGNLLTIVMSILAPVINWLGSMSPSELGRTVYAIGLAMSAMYGLLTGGPWTALAYGLFWAAAMAPLLFMAEGGVVTRPTLAIIGEKGPEAVIPLGSKGAGGIGGSNEEVVWALEDLGNKVDRTNSILRSTKRLR